jgi:hypothetical protein
VPASSTELAVAILLGVVIPTALFRPALLDDEASWPFDESSGQAWAMRWVGIAAGLVCYARQALRHEQVFDTPTGPFVRTVLAIVGMLTVLAVLIHVLPLLRHGMTLTQRLQVIGLAGITAVAGGILGLGLAVMWLPERAALPQYALILSVAFAAWWYPPRRYARMLARCIPRPGGMDRKS